MKLPNQREIDEAVLYIQDAILLLDPIENSEAIEALLQSTEFLLGEAIEYPDL